MVNCTFPVSARFHAAAAPAALFRRQERIEAGRQSVAAGLVVPDLVFDEGAEQDEPAGPLVEFRPASGGDPPSLP